MENNQFNPQAGQPNQAPQQGQPMGQQPQQFAQPQQGQPMGQQPQQFAQPQQGQPMGQQPMQGQPMGQRPGQPMQGQPMGQRPGQFAQTMPQAAPKAPMSMEKRTLFIAIGLIVTYILTYVTSTHLSLYFKDDLATNLTSIFSKIFSASSMIINYVILFLAIMTFVPEWSKKFFSYINARLVLVTVSISTIALSTLSFLALVITTIIRSNAFAAHSKNMADKYINYSTQSYTPSYTPNFFTLDFVLIPALIASAVFVLVMALPLSKNKLQKDRYMTALLITAGTFLAAAAIMFVLTLISAGSYTY